jgi:2-keto-4-pentenoate hydratase/2-oxohepta-3-ene-1,7-dioic acid hydratase in catechol pathway
MRAMPTREIRNAGFWGFWKLGREIVGPDGELIYPERCNRLDYDGEIAIVLGKRGADLKASQLKDYVWGVTLADPVVQQLEADEARMALLISRQWMKSVSMSWRYRPQPTHQS